MVSSEKIQTRNWKKKQTGEENKIMPYEIFMEFESPRHGTILSQPQLRLVPIPKCRTLVPFITIHAVNLTVDCD